MVTIVHMGIGQRCVQIGRHRDLLGSPQILMGKLQNHDIHLHIFYNIAITLVCWLFILNFDKACVVSYFDQRYNSTKYPIIITENGISSRGNGTDQEPEVRLFF